MSSGKGDLIPRPARFNDYIERKLPKSAEEVELELMEYFRMNPFRASPIRFPIQRGGTTNENVRQSEHKNEYTELNRRKTTIPESFTLHADERIKRRRERQKQEEEISESTNDDEGLRRTSFSSRSSARLSTDARHELHQKRLEEKLRLEEDERKKLCQFRAREWNREWFEYNGDKSKYLRSNNKHVHVDTPEVDFNKELQKVLERYKEHNIGSFELQSIQRHETYQKRFYERIKMEEDIQEQIFALKSVGVWGSFLAFATGNVFNPQRYDSFGQLSTTSRSPDISSTPQHSEPSPKNQHQSKILPSNENGIASEVKAPSEILSLPQTNSTEMQPSETSKSAFAIQSMSPKSLAMLVLAIFTIRVLNTFLVQTYYDPDEFWQTLEPAYCMVFRDSGDRSCPGLTWEWKRQHTQSAHVNIFERSVFGPVRSYLSIVPVYLYYQALKWLALDTNWLVARGPMILYAITVATPIDLCVWYIAKWLEPPKKDIRAKDKTLPMWCLFCSLSSWYNGYTLVRTFSNNHETLLVILAVALVSPELIGNDGRRTDYLFRACLAFFLGGLAVVVRLTALALFIPMGILLSFRQKSNYSMIGFLLMPCASFGILGILLGMVVDRIFFGFWTIPFLGNFHFNVTQNMAGIYGIHPAHWYFLSGLPAVAGLLLPFALYDLWATFVTRLKTTVTYGRQNLWIMVFSYLITMSSNAHKEFRFILPILPFMCLLSATHVRSLFSSGVLEKHRSWKVVLACSIFVLANLVALSYLGLFHQYGPIHVNSKIVQFSRHIHDANAAQSTFSVHYLTGSCHSTPLLSHLHSPPLVFADLWHLDCSPTCRSNADLICESDLFVNDPASFIEKNYFPCRGSARFTRSGCLVANAAPRSIPDFIVTFSGFVDTIKNQFSGEGFHEVYRFPYSLNGVRLLYGRLVIDPDNNLFNEVFKNYSFDNGLFDASLEEMVLFSRAKAETVCTS